MHAGARACADRKRGGGKRAKEGRGKQESRGAGITATYYTKGVENAKQYTLTIYLSYCSCACARYSCRAARKDKQCCRHQALDHKRWFRSGYACGCSYQPLLQVLYYSNARYLRCCSLLSVGDAAVLLHKSSTGLDLTSQASTHPLLSCSSGSS